LEQDDVVFVPRNDDAYFVFGEVRRPGRFLMTEHQTYRLAEAVAEAGGVAETGTSHRVYVARPGPDGKLVPVRYYLDRFLRDLRQDQNPPILPGDIVIVDHTKGTNISNVLQAISAALYIQALSHL
jgi:protein involved in polysaccharide export with SLBB domain